MAGQAGRRAGRAPLTAEEQQRFAAGARSTRRSASRATSPTAAAARSSRRQLVGSELALGPAGIPARIVLNGKEGPTGLMPPLGAALTDEQIAAALTYIRREWGHTASPVDPATVKEVRALSNGRTRPWTAEELARLRQGQF